MPQQEAATHEHREVINDQAAKMTQNNLLYEVHHWSDINLAVDI